MSDTTAGNGSTFIVNTDEVSGTGYSITSEAHILIGANDTERRTLLYFYNNFTTIKQTNFPDALQGVFGTFIQNQYDNYHTILQNREAIGLILQNKVAPESEITDDITKQQFQQQLNEMQNGPVTY